VTLIKLCRFKPRSIVIVLPKSVHFSALYAYYCKMRMALLCEIDLTMRFRKEAFSISSPSLSTIFFKSSVKERSFFMYGF